MCFQALLGCQGPTTASSPLSKDPTVYFSLWVSKSAVQIHSYSFMLPILPLTYQNTHFGSVLWVSESVVGLKQPPRAWKHIGGASLFGGLVVIVVDLGAQKDKFAANSGPKPVEEIKLLWNLMPVQTVLLLTFFLDDPVHDQPLENYPFTFQNPLRIKWLVKWIVSKKMPMSF